MRGAGDSNREWTAAVVKLAVLYGIRKSRAFSELFASAPLSRELFAPPLRKSQKITPTFSGFFFPTPSGEHFALPRSLGFCGIMSIFSGAFFGGRCLSSPMIQMKIRGYRSLRDAMLMGGSQPLTDPAQGCRNLIWCLLFRFNKSGLNEALGKVIPEQLDARL